MEKRYVTPAEVCGNFLAVGERKAALPLDQMLVMAVLAGAFIALAGVASTWGSMLVENLSLRRLIAGCVFQAGLAMVVPTGTELFTGNCLMSIAVLEALQAHGIDGAVYRISALEMAEVIAD